MSQAGRRIVARSFDPASGVVATAEVEGDSVEAVRALLEAQGKVVLHVGLRRTGLGVRHWRPKGLDPVLLCDELRTLLMSGMSLVEAVDTLHDKESAGYKRQVLGGLRAKLKEGKALSTAMERTGHDFSPLLIASVRASERSSGLVGALDEYIAYESVARDLNRKIATAAIYPALVVAFGMAVCLFMLGYVVPRFAHVYDDFAQGISLPTMILLRVAGFFDAYFWCLSAAAAVAAGLSWMAYRRGSLQRWALSALSRVGVARRYLRLYQLARLYQTMSMLLRGGFTLSDAMPLAQNLALDATLHAQVAQARTRLMEGQRLSRVFDDAGLTDVVALRMLQVGERSGNLAHVMAVIAQTYRTDFTLFIERATKIAEPLILMVTGMLIGALIILMYMPVFDLAGSL